MSLTRPDLKAKPPGVLSYLAGFVFAIPFVLIGLAISIFIFTIPIGIAIVFAGCYPEYCVDRQRLRWKLNEQDRDRPHQDMSAAPWN